MNSILTFIPCYAAALFKADLRRTKRTHQSWKDPYVIEHEGFHLRKRVAN